MLFDERTEFPGLAVLKDGFVRTLTAGSPDAVEVFSETMELSRFGSARHLLLLRDYLRAKYEDKKIDVAVAVMGPALNFLLSQGSAIFPGTPIVFSGIGEGEIDDRKLPSHITGVFVKREFAPTLDLALGLHPNTSRIVVVAGTSEFDIRLLDTARKEFHRYENRLAFTYLTALPMTRLLAELARLPPRTVVLFTTLIQDGAGEPFVPHNVVERVSAAANAPVYGFVDQYLGHGIVGGSMYSLAAHGPEAANLTLRILAGTDPSRLAPVVPKASLVLFDWRQLQRWGISENQLPVGSEVRFRQPTILGQYWWQILLAVAVIAIQTLLIIGLLHQRRRRALAEVEMHQRASELATVNRRTIAGELSGSIAHEINQPLTAIVASASAALRWLNMKTPDLGEARSSLERIVSDGYRAAKVVDNVRGMFKKDVQKRTAVSTNELIDQVLDLLRSDLSKHDVTVRKVETQGLPPVCVDHVQIQQVLINLIRNAIEAMSAVTDRQRILHVRTERNEAGDVIITVEDSGPGLDPDNIDKIFAPFFTTKPQGMGMGLSICRSIVQAHGGRLSAGSSRSKGALFEIALPTNDEVQ